MVRLIEEQQKMEKNGGNMEVSVTSLKLNWAQDSLH